MTGAKSLKLSREEVGVLAHALTLASRTLKSATNRITTEHGLGPRGAWILRLIDGGLVTYPSDITRFFQVSPSMVTSELASLTEAGLITQRQSLNDRRRVDLILTARGKRVALRVQEQLAEFITERFSAHSRTKVLELGRMLQDFVSLEPDNPR